MEQGIIEKGKNLHQVYDEAMILGVSPRDKWKEAELSASSDTGDVSRIMPTCLLRQHAGQLDALHIHGRQPQAEGLPSEIKEPYMHLKWQQESYMISLQNHRS